MLGLLYQEKRAELSLTWTKKNTGWKSPAILSKSKARFKRKKNKKKHAIRVSLSKNLLLKPSKMNWAKSTNYLKMFISEASGSIDSRREQRRAKLRFIFSPMAIRKKPRL